MVALRTEPSTVVRASVRLRVLILGAGAGVRQLLDDLSEGSTPSREIIGVLSDVRPALPSAVRHLGALDRLSELLATGDVDEVAFCLGSSAWPRADELARICSASGVAVSMPLARASSDQPLVRAVTKRALDIVGATVGLVLLAPLLALTAALIRLVDGRPVLFRQPRAGLGGRPFMIAKFRTMNRDADALRSHLRALNEVGGGASFKMRDDPRVTRLGRFLRQTSIDELPQLWNVLRGEMSLVGPRPHPYDDLAGYKPWQFRRLSAKPGITGLWQVELRGDPEFDLWVAKDLEYIDRWSIWIDLLLIARTIPAIVRRTGR